MKIKGWENFQHYKDRSPPWIKLHKSLLDNYEFQSLPLASRALAPMLWLLASEQIDGDFDGNVSKLAFRLRRPEKEISDGLNPLIKAGFIIDDSMALAQCKQPAIPETEAEGKTETKKEGEKEAKANAPLRMLISLGIDSKIASDWIILRKQKKAAITETAIKGIQREAEKAGMSLENALAMCCERGWTGFKAEWVNRKLGKNPNEGRDLDAEMRAFAGEGNVIEGESKNVG